MISAYNSYPRHFNTEHLARTQQVFEALGLIGFQILATTRNKDVTPASPGWHSLMVPEMEEDAALLVLSKCSGATRSVPTQPALQVSVSFGSLGEFQPTETVCSNCTQWCTFSR